MAITESQMEVVTMRLETYHGHAIIWSDFDVASFSSGCRPFEASKLLNADDAEGSLGIIP